MATESKTTEESAYAKDAEEATGGKAVGPEHDQSFHAEDFYDPKTGKRIETPWDSEQQRNDPGFDPKVMAGTVEQSKNQAQAKAKDQAPPADAKSATGEPASGGEGGETKTAPPIKK
jgi:hypothetical protein